MIASGPLGTKPATRSPVDTEPSERPGDARHLAVELGEGEDPATAPFIPADDGVGPVPPAEQVLGEVEPGPGEPVWPIAPGGRGHAITSDEDRIPGLLSGALSGHDPAEAPEAAVGTQSSLLVAPRGTSGDGWAESIRTRPWDGP